MRAATKAPNAAPTPVLNEPIKGISKPPNQPATPSTAPEPTAKASRPPAPPLEAVAGGEGFDCRGAGACADDPPVPPVVALISRSRRSMSLEVSSAMSPVCSTKFKGPTRR
jgi:hypothetical protein